MTEHNIPEDQTIDYTEAEVHEPSGLTPGIVERRPAETTTVIAGVVALGAYFGLDLDASQLAIILAAIAALPAVVSGIVSRYRQAIYGSPPLLDSDFEE